MRDTKVKYVLQDIELWHHKKNTYPHRIVPIKNPSNLRIGSRYTVAEYAVAEKKISAYYNARRYDVKLMNPLYQHNNILETVLTIDLYPEPTNRKNLVTSHIQEFKWFNDVINAVHEHQKYTNNIHMYGGSLELERMHDIFFIKRPCTATTRK